jgi:signal recognition particle receptor subunit beta
VDGVIFVADSQREMMDANVESLRNLEQNLKAQGYDIRSIPYVLQLNKRDLPSAVPVEEMKAKLSIDNELVLEAIAASEEGIGVFDTLKPSPSSYSGPHEIDLAACYNLRFLYVPR